MTESGEVWILTSLARVVLFRMVNAGTLRRAFFIERACFSTAAPSKNIIMEMSSDYPFYLKPKLQRILSE
jgi:hypothetical protein